MTLQTFQAIRKRSRQSNPGQRVTVAVWLRKFRKQFTLPEYESIKLRNSAVKAVTEVYSPYGFLLRPDFFE